MPTAVGTLLFALGNHGVFVISAGPGHEGFDQDERQFAAILASSTENALNRVEKEQKLERQNERLD